MTKIANISKWNYNNLIILKHHFLFRVLFLKDLYIQQKKHFGGAFVNITHSTVHVPTIIYSLGKRNIS